MMLFLDIMKDAVKTPNVVEATNKAGLYDRLEKLKVSGVPPYKKNVY